MNKSFFSLFDIFLSLSFLPSFPPSFLPPSPPMLKHHRQNMSVFIVYESFWNPGPIHCARLCFALTRKLAFDKFLNLIFFVFVFCLCDCLILRHYLSLRLGSFICVFICLLLAPLFHCLSYSVSRCFKSSQSVSCLGTWISQLDKQGNCPVEHVF